MTEIPEHLLKRAQAAREKAASDASDAAEPAAAATSGESDSRIPPPPSHRPLLAVACPSAPAPAATRSGC